MAREKVMEALASDYRHGDVIASHCHADTQLIHAICGVMLVNASNGSWVVPSGHALWVPPGMAHGIRMTGDVHMRTLLIKPQAHRPPPQACQVIKVSLLLRELIVAATDEMGRSDNELRHHHIIGLLSSELEAAQTVLTHVPIPDEPRLKTLCADFIDNPSQSASLEDWAAQLNMSTRTLARLFQRELGMSGGEWRKRARLILSLQRLASGVSILEVALEHGYQSPSAFTAMFKRTLGYTPRDCHPV